MFGKLFFVLMAVVVAALAMPAPDDDDRYYAFGSPSFRTYEPVAYRPISYVAKFDRDDDHRDRFYGDDDFHDD